MELFENYEKTPLEPEKNKHCLMYRVLQCLIVICLCTFCLSGCYFDGTSSNNSSDDSYFADYPDTNTPTTYPYPQLFPEDSDTFDNYHVNSIEKPHFNEVAVPESYHLGISNTPPASKDEDMRWIARQNPNGYTIQVTENAKPAPVANTLQQLSKSNHSAEVRSQSGAYLGLHGSYATQEEATQALDKLPVTVKEQAKIKHWDTIQHEVQ